MRGAVVAIAVLGSSIPAVSATALDHAVLVAPSGDRGAQSFSLAVKVGAIGRQRVDVATGDGQFLGAITLFGVRPGEPGGTFHIPVPAEALKGGKLDVRFKIVGGGSDPTVSRAPTEAEVVSAVLEAAPD